MNRSVNGKRPWTGITTATDGWGIAWISLSGRFDFRLRNIPPFESRAHLYGTLLPGRDAEVSPDAFLARQEKARLEQGALDQRLAADQVEGIVIIQRIAGNF